MLSDSTSNVSVGAVLEGEDGTFAVEHLWHAIDASHAHHLDEYSHASLTSLKMSSVHIRWKLLERAPPALARWSS